MLKSRVIGDNKWCTVDLVNCNYMAGAVLRMAKARGVVTPIDILFGMTSQRQRSGWPMVKGQDRHRLSKVPITR